jgi:hypothetical protein
MLKSVLEITASEMKSIINEDIGKSIKWGIIAPEPNKKRF